MSDTQPWYSQLLRMLKDVPRTLPQRSDTLQMPGGKGMAQSLVKKMTLMVCRVSRRSLKTQGISKRALLQPRPQGFPSKNGWGGKRPWHRLVTCTA